MLLSAHKCAQTTKRSPTLTNIYLTEHTKCSLMHIIYEQTIKHLPNHTQRSLTNAPKCTFFMWANHKMLTHSYQCIPKGANQTLPKAHYI